MSLQSREVGKTAVSTQMKMVQPKKAIKDANTTNDAINDIDMHYHNNIVDLSNTSSSSNNASIPISISQLKTSLLSGASFSLKNINKSTKKVDTKKIDFEKNNKEEEVTPQMQPTITSVVLTDEHSGGSTSLTPPCLADIIDLLSDDDHDDDEDTLYDSDSGSQGDDDVLCISLQHGSIEKMFHMTTSDDDNSFQPMLQVIHVLEVVQVQAASKRWKVSFFVSISRKYSSDNYRDIFLSDSSSYN